MKRIGAIVLAVVFVMAIMGCSRGPEVSQEEATEALNVAFGAFFIALLSSEFGEEPEGVEIDEEVDAVTFTDFEPAEMETRYTSISGVIGGGGENVSVADLELAGGPVKTIEFEILEDQDAGNATEMDITVNGHDMTISIDEFANW